MHACPLYCRGLRRVQLAMISRLLSLQQGRRLLPLVPWCLPLYSRRWRAAAGAKAPAAAPKCRGERFAQGCYANPRRISPASAKAGGHRTLLSTRRKPLQACTHTIRPYRPHQQQAGTTPPAVRVGFAAAAAVPLIMAPALPPPLGLESLPRIASSQRGLGLSPAAAGDFEADTLNAPAGPGMAEPLRAPAREQEK